MVQFECNGVNEEEDKIKDLNTLLQNSLGKHITVIKTETKRLTSAGENYGSEMLAADVHIRNNETDKSEIMHLVAKMCPPNEYLKELFHTSTTFKKEIEFYNSIVPAMQEIQIEQGISDVIDCFPECFGARVSLDLNSNNVDDDAVILLENLKISSFQVMDRMKGFDLETTKMLLNDLAVFHAVPIGVKLLKPETFIKKVLPHLSRNRKFDSLTERSDREVINNVINAIKTKPKCLPFLPDIQKSLELCLANLKKSTSPSEPYATLNHNDYWVNNTMIKIENDKLVKNKMVDFQLIDYGSPGNDIVFLLFSSVQLEVLNEHYDDLIRLYYDKFISTLKELNCDTTKFTFEKLEEEIEICAKERQFAHVLIMLKYILAIQDKVKELSEITEEDIVSEGEPSDEYMKKVPEIAYEFIKRKWLCT